MSDESAFPKIKIETQDGDWVHSTGGITIRDYFAAKAMQSLLLKATAADIAKYEPDKFRKMLAFGAYAAADAMLAQRGGES